MSPLAKETWIVTEGAIGMENQCLGLAERLPIPARTFRVQLKNPWQWLSPYSMGSAFAHLASSSDRLAPPWPRLLIGCGRQSVPFSRAIKRVSGGRTFTVQCQDPRLPVSNFDLVIPPAHDEISGPNVFSIIGSPNRITPAKLMEARKQFAPLFESLAAPRVGVLVGGASRTHGSLDPPGAERLGQMLAAVARDHGLMVTTSRRTSPGADRIIRRQLEDTEAFVWDRSGQNPYLGMLAWADAFVVTADSVNMICEAASTGKPVHVFSLPGGRRKAQLFQRSVAQRGISRPFGGRIEQWSYAPLDETGVAVERIKTLLDLREPASDMQGEGP